MLAHPVLLIIVENSIVDGGKLTNMIHLNYFRNTAIFLLILGHFVALFATPLQATAYTITPESDFASNQELLQFLAERSELVVACKLLSSQSELSYFPRFQKEIIVTRWQVAVTTTLKGNLVDQTLSFITPGGCLDDQGICFRTSLFPEFSENDLLLLFLKNTPEGNWYIPDILAGFLRISDNNLISTLNITVPEVTKLLKGAK